MVVLWEKKKKIKKTRISIYLPEHLSNIAESAFKNKSEFVTKAIEFYVNNELGLKKHFNELYNRINKL